MRHPSGTWPQGAEKDWRSNERHQRAQSRVVGTGFMGVVHVEALRRLGVEVGGVCAETPEVAQEKGFSYPLPPIYDGLDDLLADPRVDVSTLSLPMTCTTLK